MDKVKLQIIMCERGYNSKKLSQKLNVSEKTLYSKMSGKIHFTMDEVINLIEILKIDDPRTIFFI